ncbi:2-C-methyl-D-erythritol 4-phosphate cytidylyltransferase [Texcoconibacillus texcoconensis]|uniref:2-C-methyl-D-erythritol 4-phosphate cytidylyltransferase n=1 Tax=Texcoconibacillus texcoconensis TaxID=1095777 RepID=A0A840QUJ0_9BACI|nr:2-C-methyl-D-erythritol 4-phosphate cytidylyltransferase [Texcoconibacillus texcoconensis]MBB5175010.1 2-C-methyl-D-erythritol 4-phosphate cytidylyltransferase [Texcoconibacillus texcoconensis]
MERYVVVIPAAGQGKRMGTGANKTFLSIDRDPLIVHTLRVFERDERCERIVLVCREKEKADIQGIISSYQFKKVSDVVTGGAERQQSVFEGLKVIKDNPVVLIHDGARPFIQKETIHRLTDHVLQNGEAAIAAVPVKDTVKRVNEEGDVEETMKRSSLWAVQTPQAFRLSSILSAHKKAEAHRFCGTDDASLIEYVGGKVKVVEGSYDNIKVTTPEDLWFAEAIIQQRKGGK